MTITLSVTERESVWIWCALDYQARKRLLDAVDVLGYDKPDAKLQRKQSRMFSKLAKKVKAGK